MRISIVLSAIAACALIGGVAEARAPRQTGEAKLAKIVEGREAGHPVSCLRLNDIRSSRIVDGTAIVYQGMNGTLYINRPASGAPFLHDGLTLVTDTHTDQLCNVDVVRLMDMTSRMPAGSVGLGQFVPYPAPHRHAR